jgi:two-component system cell cycle sensor histidine kinase/response regulator CckA
LSDNVALPADRPALRRAVADALSGMDLPIELRVRIPTRPEEPLVMTLAPAPVGAGTLLVAVRDIREQLRLERQVAQVTKMQAIGQLAGGVAHDFNNILTANLGLVDQLLARHRPGDEDFEDLDQVRLNNARGANLVRQLLAFARQQTLRLQLVDIRAVIAPLAALLERLLGESVHLELEFGTGVGPIRVDPGQLEQVIVNLAVNARDAMPGGGKLCITTRAVPANAVAALGHGVMPAADFVEIAVRDSGTGIPPALGSKIFEPFFTTKEAGKGTGLGLSTVYGIVKQSGGFVFNAPAPGGGTVFTLFFPRAAGDVVVAPPAAIEVDDGAGAGRGRELLLVEDDRAVRLVLRRALAGAGFKVTEAVDALAALPIVDDTNHVIDIMVTDVMMPGMDGPQLVQRARMVRPGLPVVMMSGYAEPPQRARVGERSTAFLAKPFGGAALIAAVRATLATRAD